MTALEALNLAAPIADAYMSVEERLLVWIARQLSLNDDHQLNEVSKWQLKQLAKHGLLRQDAHKIIAAGTKGIPGDVAETVRQAIDDTLAEDGIRDLWHNEGFSESAKNAVKHYRAQAKDVYNQVNTVMKYKAESTFVRAVNSVAEKWQVLRNTELAGTSQGSILRKTAEQRREQAEIADKQGVLDILNSNTASVVSGAESRTKAVRTTIHEMAQKGIPAFVDKSGREWSPEAYVNMDIRATVKNTALEAQFSTMDSLGQDVFEVSSHPGSRPKCRPWQGKLISRSGRTTEITDINGRKHKVIPLSQTSFGEPDGLFGINCGHRPRGVSDGLFRKSSVEYDDTEDKELYNKVCKQRELERKVRKSKTEADMLEAAGDTEGAKEVRRKMAEQNKALKSYCDSNGLKYRSDRVRTYGSVNNGGKLRESGSKKPITAITDETVAKVPKVTPKTYSDDICEKIHQEHQKLLKTSMMENGSKEVAFILNSDMTGKRVLHGTDDKIEFGAFYGKDLFLMHNHPRNNSFSIDDVVEFFGENSLKSMSVVKNNGKIEVLTKLTEYDRIDLIRELDRMVRKQIKTGSDAEYRAVVNKFLNKYIDMGVIEWLK
nr:MAG TPA: minor capsid protein [Caudoviricetes sp.]